MALNFIYKIVITWKERTPAKDYWEYLTNDFYFDSSEYDNLLHMDSTLDKLSNWIYGEEEWWVSPIKKEGGNFIVDVENLKLIAYKGRFPDYKEITETKIERIVRENLVNEQE